MVTLDASWAIELSAPSTGGIRPSLTGPGSQAPRNAQGRQDPLLAWTAQDLQDKLFRMAGLSLPILHRPGPETSGPSGAPDDSGAPGLPDTPRPLLLLEVLAPPEPTLGRDGFRIQVQPASVRIQANTALGVAFGAMEVLERLGCRWFAPGAYHIPRTQGLRLPTGTTSSVPAFPVRRVRSTSAADPEWCLRNRLNSGYTFPPGTAPRAYFLDGCHSFSRLVPPTLFPEHPELFSLVAGKRRPGSQLCLSNPQVAEFVRAALAVTFRRHKARGPSAPPDASGGVAAHVSQNDNLWWCECSRCTALAAKYGGQSGLLLHFLNPLARWVSEQFPGHRIATLAYTYTQAPPQGIAPDPDLVVRFCNYRPNCQIHPLASCPKNRANYRNLQAWARLTRSLHLYEYMINFRLFPLPCPNLEAMAENIRLYRDLGVAGVDYTGTPCPGAWMAELKSYLAARLLWNPDLNPGRLEEEFLSAYYGPAAGAVAGILELTRRTASTTGAHPDLYGYGGEPAWSQDYLQRLDPILDQAKRAAAPHKAFSSRLLPLELTSALLHALSPQRTRSDLERLDRLARSAGADLLGAHLPAGDLCRRIGSLQPEAGITLRTRNARVACTLRPGLGGQLTDLHIARLGDRPLFPAGQTPNPLRPDGIRWILGGTKDAWNPPPTAVQAAGEAQAALTRPIGPTAPGCQIEISTALRQDPPAIKFMLRIQNPTDQACAVPLSLGLTLPEVPEVALAGATRPVRFEHPLKAAVIPIEGPGPVTLTYRETRLTLTLASDIQPRNLLIPAHPEETRIPLHVSFGSMTLAPGVAQGLNVWVFLQALPPRSHAQPPASP